MNSTGGLVLGASSSRLPLHSLNSKRRPNQPFDPNIDPATNSRRLRAPGRGIDTVTVATPSKVATGFIGVIADPGSVGTQDTRTHAEGTPDIGCFSGGDA